jgi:hypothetical protein
LKPSAITSSCAPAFCGDSSYTVEWFPEGKYRERESATVHPEMADAAYEDELKKIIAFRTKEECWEPIVIRLLDGSDLEQRRAVVK